MQTRGTSLHTMRTFFWEEEEIAEKRDKGDTDDDYNGDDDKRRIVRISFISFSFFFLFFSMLLLNLFIYAWTTFHILRILLDFYIEIIFPHQRNYFGIVYENILIQQSPRDMWNSHLLYFTPHNYLGTALWYGLSRNCTSSLGRGKKFVQNNSRARLVSYSGGTLDSFPRGDEAAGPWHWLLISIWCQV
jgi:hypothetical protein